MSRKTNATGSSDAAPTPTPNPISFEEALGRLEEIVRQLEEGALGLSDSLARYEEGMQCLKQCHQALEQAERRIELLTSVDAEGRPATEPFDETQMTLEEKAASRSRRRSKSDSAERSRPRSDSDEETDAGRDGRLF